VLATCGGSGLIPCSARSRDEWRARVTERRPAMPDLERTGGAPGDRTLNRRIKRRPLSRSERTACTNVPRICTESTGCTECPLVLVPRVVPRHQGKGARDSVTESSRGLVSWRWRSRHYRLCYGPGSWLVARRPWVTGNPGAARVPGVRGHENLIVGIGDLDGPPYPGLLPVTWLPADAAVPPSAEGSAQPPPGCLRTGERNMRGHRYARTCREG
jgi:hypothetical protein